MGKFKIPEVAQTAGQYIAALRKSVPSLARQELIDALDVISERLKADIINSRTEIKVAGRSYYVANGGSDTNDGASPCRPWASIARVNAADLKPGDAVLFSRAGFFRGSLKAKEGVAYSAYGEGAKPILCASLRNYASPALWQKTGIKNVYAYAGRLKNVGIMAFDHSRIIGKHDEITGKMKVSGVGGFTSQSDLRHDGEHYSDLADDKLYLYSESGNPGERFASIEIAVREGDNITAADGITVDNLCLMYGNYGVASGARKHLVVTNNIMCWMGGAILPNFGGADLTRSGNAVEIYGALDGYTVNHNYIYQVYDTAITHQYSAHSEGDCHMKGVTYIGNLVECCHWSIEFYNQPRAGTNRTVSDVHIADNILRNGGSWGSAGREAGATLFNSFRLPEDTKNFVAENNIFDRSAGLLLRLQEGGDRGLEAKDNIYLQHKGGGFAFLFGREYKFDDKVQEVIKREYAEAHAIAVSREK